MVVGTALGLARALGKTRPPTPKVDSQQRLAALGAILGQAGVREGEERASPASPRGKTLIPIPPKRICSGSTDQELAGQFPLSREDYSSSSPSPGTAGVTHPGKVSHTLTRPGVMPGGPAAPSCRSGVAVPAAGCDSGLSPAQPRPPALLCRQRCDSDSSAHGFLPARVPGYARVCFPCF